MKTTIKARVLATNEVVRVYQAKEGDMHFIDENNNPYKCEELDFNVEEQPIDPMERLEKMMDIFKPTPLPKFPTQDEINASNLKFETALHEMEVKRMRMQFKSDFIIACIDNGIVDDLGKRAEDYARDIFDKQ